VSIHEPPPPDSDEPYAIAALQYREITSEHVPRLVDQYASATGLPVSNPRFQFLVAQAILGSALTHLDVPKRKRWSVIRKEMLNVEKAASAAAKNSRQLQIALDNLTPLYRDAIFKNVQMPIRAALDYETLSHRAHIYAKDFDDKGGVPPKMAEFRALVRGLAYALRDATGRLAKVTWNDYTRKYEGDFVELLEITLPLTLTCAERGGWRMSYPRTRRARGRYIYNMTRSGAISRTSYFIS
jgi:hypothetical protein